MDSVQFHDAANIFPLDDENIAGLSDDIRKNGQQQAIELIDGKILDGRRRYLACRMAGVTPQFRTVSPADPIAYVLSLNLHRRHLTPSQLAMVGARAREVYDKQATLRQSEAGGDHRKKALPVNLPEALKGDARDLAGKAVGVSGKSIDHATRVLTKGVPELAKAVEEGRMAISTAALLATEPEDVQLAEIANPKRSRVYKPGFGGGSAPAKKKEAEPESVEGVAKGVGVIKGHEAVDCLRRIPKNDPSRNRGFQIVLDWIKHAKKGD